jgi:TRAP-type C4-dicarboxylate transport system permease small subunit
MWFKKLVARSGKVADRIIRWINHAGVTVLAMMMFLTVTDVTLRYGFNKPVLGSFEITEFMMTILAACTIGYAAVLKAHVNVDLVFTRLPERIQGIISVFTSLVCVAFFGLMSWRNIYQSSVLRNAHSVSSALSIPEFPFVFILGIGFGIIALVFLVELLKSIKKAVGQWTPSP